MAHRPKPGSKADREALRHEMTRRGSVTADIAVEMRVRFGMRPREAFRHAHGWTLQQTSDRLNDLSAQRPGAAVAADASLVGKWERWPAPAGRRPSLNVLLLLAEVFGCRMDELLDLEDRRAMPESDLRVLAHQAAAAEPPREAGMQPSPATAAAAEPTGPEMVRTAAAEAADWARWAEASNVGDLALEQLVAETRALSADYLVGEPLPLFAQARRLRDQVWALLEGRQYPRQTRDLYSVAGYLCGILAWISSDLGQLREADTQGRTAWLCAELADHRDLRAWVLSTRSKVAFWDGRMRDAIGFARRGADYRPDGSAGVLLACQEADAWSQLGAAEEARAALHRSLDVRESVTTPDEIGGLLSCGDYRRANYTAAVQLRVGEPGSALRTTQAALGESAAQPYGTVAQMRIAQAAAHLALNGPEAAAEALLPVLALPPEQRLDPVTRRLRELAAAVARSPAAGSRPAARLQEAIEEFALDSAPRRLALTSGNDVS